MDRKLKYWLNKEELLLSEIKCLVCKGKHFRKGYYELDISTDIYSKAYNTVKTYARSIDSDISIDVDVDVDTDIYHAEITSKGDIDFRIKSESRYEYDECPKVYKYICEDCGFIMSFTKEKGIESKHQEQKRKEKENMYDWTGFGK